MSHRYALYKICVDSCSSLLRSSGCLWIAIAWFRCESSNTKVKNILEIIVFADWRFSSDENNNDNDDEDADDPTSYSLEDIKTKVMIFDPKVANDMWFI